MNGESRTLAAFWWMMGAVVSFVLMAVAGREISVELNTFELMLYRSIIGFLLVLGVVALSKRGFSQVRTTLFKRHLWRSTIHFTGQNLWFYAIALIPLSQLVAIEFTNPLWVALLAPLMLGEALTRKTLFIAITGFVGVVIVADPGGSALTMAHFAAIGAAIGFALTTIATRQIMRRDTVLCVLFWMTLIQAGFALVIALPGGIPWPSAAIWPWLFVVGTGGVSAHYCLTAALGLAPATIVAPMDFIRLPVITLVGLLAYGEQPKTSFAIGAIIIIAANIVNLRQRP